MTGKKITLSSAMRARDVSRAPEQPEQADAMPPARVAHPIPTPPVRPRPRSPEVTQDVKVAKDATAVPEARPGKNKRTRHRKRRGG